MAAADPFDSALDLLRRLNPKHTSTHLNALISLAPELTEDLLSSVDQPLAVRRCRQTGREYLLCDYNRDGDSYRSPWSNEFDPAAEGEARMFFITLKSDEVSFLSSLSLTYRALPPTPNGPHSRTFSTECVESARAAIASHLEATALMSDEQSLKIVYIHWTILYAPFIPFIVIFCLVIETSDAADLARLHAFVTSLETACEVSSSVRKLHQLCHVLYTVAALYVEAKAAQPVGGGSEFDVYLSQLGFMPVDEAAGGMTGMPPGVVGLGEDGRAEGMAMQASSLEDWFSGKNYMMGLLEEDLSGINPVGWPS
ncbi:hypothetical protein CHU98_g11896 [Xylaria longipes]|nr:hypothetical protein CHU98_g11896 [Xylaria longipes]